MSNLLDDLFGDVEQQLDDLEKSAYVPKNFVTAAEMGDEYLDALVDEIFGGELGAEPSKLRRV